MGSVECCCGGFWKGGTSWLITRPCRYKLQTIFDGTGTQQAASEFKKVEKTVEGAGQAQEKAGKQAETHGRHIAGLHKLFHSLNEILLGTGALMQAAFSPIGAAISIGVMALNLFHEKMKEFNEDCRRAAEEAAKPLTRRLEEQRETTVRTAEGMERLRDRLDAASKSEDGMKESTARATREQ